MTPGRQDFVFLDRPLPDAKSDGTMRKRGPTAYKKHEERVHSRLRQRPLHSNTSSCRVSTNSILNDFSFRENRGEKEPSEIQRNGSRKWKTNLERYIKVIE